MRQRSRWCKGHMQVWLHMICAPGSITAVVVKALPRSFTLPSRFSETASHPTACSVPY